MILKENNFEAEISIYIKRSTYTDEVYFTFVIEQDNPGKLQSNSFAGSLGFITWGKSKLELVSQNLKRIDKHDKKLSNQVVKEVIDYAQNKVKNLTFSNIPKLCYKELLESQISFYEKHINKLKEELENESR